VSHLCLGLSTTHSKLFVCRLSSVVCRLSSVVCRLSSVVCRLSSVVCHLSSVICRLSPVACRLSPVACRLSSVSTSLALYSPQRFVLDEKEEYASFLQLQRQLHPDKLSNLSQDEQEEAAQAASIINYAHDTLKNPLKRARYLLAIRGHDVDETETMVDQMTLLEIMELRESIEDASGDPERTEQLLEHTSRLYNDCVVRLAASFDSDTSNIDETVHNVNLLTYYQNALNLVRSNLPAK
jgi:molecular chaperone HscB